MNAKKEKRRFVLIDDDAIYRTIMSQVASKEGMELDVYESLAAMGSVGLLGTYDAAIVDYDLGTLTGVEIGEYLTSLFGNIPMILVSEKERRPGGNGWPKSIQSFVPKTEGYAATLAKARMCVEGKKKSDFVE